MRTWSVSGTGLALCTRSSSLSMRTRTSITAQCNDASGRHRRPRRAPARGLQAGLRLVLLVERADCVHGHPDPEAEPVPAYVQATPFGVPSAHDLRQLGDGHSRRAEATVAERDYG